MQNILLPAIVFSLFLCFQKQHDSNVSLPTRNIAAAIQDSVKWYLKKIHHDSGIVDVKTRKAFIRLDIRNGKAGGNGSCNSFGSALTVTGDTISFTHTFSTKMYCDEIQSTENYFFSLLQKVNRYEVHENFLSLFKDQSLLLEFEKQ
jgi:heat shock protein HslJ